VNSPTGISLACVPSYGGRRYTELILLLSLGGLFSELLAGGECARFRRYHCSKMHGVNASGPTYGVNASGHGVNASGPAYGVNASGHGVNAPEPAYGINALGPTYGINASGHGANASEPAYGVNASGHGVNASGPAYATLLRKLAWNLR
jgi:hypothetical protein